MTMSYTEPTQRLRHTKTKIVSFSKLLSTLSCFGFCFGFSSGWNIPTG